MNANFGIFSLKEKVRKKDRKDVLAKNALTTMEEKAKLVNEDFTWLEASDFALQPALPLELRQENTEE
ncbi:hypothetical protein EVA_14375 [gut metagenome]|uniref:Uncharacterized protein n=1 Tax=gut metagenome TaxID=749906 RepID=J9FSP1_9ZZZZ